MKKEVNKKKIIVFGTMFLSVVSIAVVIALSYQKPKESYAANSLYDAVQTDTITNGRGGQYTSTTSDCWKKDIIAIEDLDKSCNSNNTSLYCAARNDAKKGYGDVYKKGTGDCYSKTTPNSVVTSATITAKFYYQSSSTSGSTIIKSTSVECETSNDSCNITIPNAVKNSVGTYNNSYAGLSTSVGTMNAGISSSEETVTISSDETYYAIYSSQVQNYYYSS